MRNRKLQLTSLIALTFVTCRAQVLPVQGPTGYIASGGASYHPRGPAVQGAPGQLMLLTVYNLKTQVPHPTLAVRESDGRPVTSLYGISAELVQGDPITVTPLELRAIQQGYCGGGEACSTITSLTLQLPLFLDRGTRTFPSIRIRENGESAGAVLLALVPDNIHVLNTCDATMITVGGSGSVPPDICTPAVLVNGRLNSLYNLVRAGDQVALWAYGLGLLNRSASDVSLNAPFTGSSDVLINFDFRPNAPASPPVPGFGATSQPTYVGYAGAGTYQVNFAIPLVPSSLPACDGNRITSNLTVTIAGQNSWDAAQLCVAVQ